MEYAKMIYEIGIYNQLVRDCLRRGDDWTGFISVSFEEVIYFERQGKSLKDMKLRAEEEWPKRAGFVIDYIKLVIHDN
tara:strand:+ start:501 stop:734 length:234 start_codon:yes stop_codon:yes gene_type:complete